MSREGLAFIIDKQGASMLRTWTEALHNGRGRWVRPCIAPQLW